MPWLFLLLALASLAVAFKSSSPALVAVWLLVSLALFVAWVMGLLARRVGSRSRDISHAIDPEEMRRLREQAEARKAAMSNTDGPR
ncbi:hypothetical protein [Marilutibacter aestuarii]|uniref:Uncharacterized protein n=1 Tax=Marilutibacter aestuarii TaxID=1706195 RepID=A0A507ZRD0_9GAMM|nr:hypothetical protein [Lysobacter aestuarii]TQD39929.1 hypothetical protein FKV25_14840 [Lysobacter aestuarii]